MEKHIYDEKNGLSYTLCGDYYLPDLVLNEEEPIYGKYGIEYSCAVTPQVRQTGNRLSGLAGTAYASLLA